MRIHLFAGVVSTCATLFAQAPQDYSEGVAIPHTKTPAEAQWSGATPSSLTTYSQPTGPLHCVAEYEPMAGIIIAYEGPQSWKNILATMAMNITTIGNARVYVACDSSSEVTTARNHFNSAGVVSSKMKYVVHSTNSIWMRDYGPRYCYEGDVRVIVDHQYNIFSRTLDNSFPSGFASYFGHERYHNGLVHGGGNYHLDATGVGRATRLINNENGSLSEGQIVQRWQDYQNLNTVLYDPFPTSVDATQHIDMWMQVIADDKVIISDWPNNPGSTQDNICDSTAASMQAEGFTVYRIPAYSVGGTHYTFTNVVMCNNLVLIPSYTNSTAAASNATAENTWSSALPTKTIVQVPCQDIVTAAGVMHCIVMHLPAHLGGVAPTAYLRTPNGGEVFGPGEIAEISWISDDNNEVESVDLEFSDDGGATFSTIATGLAPNGKYAWNVPANCTAQGRVRVVARDPSGNTGSDDSDADFEIECSPLAQTYGSGKPGSFGVPSLTATAPQLGSTMTMDLVNGYPNALLLLLNGSATASVPFDFGFIQVAVDGVTQLQCDGNGELHLPVPLPLFPEIAGLSLYWQAWIHGDPAAIGAGWSASNGLQTRFGL